MKRLLFFTSALLLISFLGVSCNKEQNFCSFPENGDDNICYVDLNFNVVNGPKVKAMNSDEVPITDWVKRLDLYTYYTDKPSMNAHYTIIPEEGEDIKFQLAERKYSTAYVLAFANLDEDTANNFYGKALDVLCNRNKAESHLVLSAGNFDFDRIPMVGSNYYQFYDDGKMTINLYRIMSRIDIDKISVQFDDLNLLGKEVYVKNIVIANMMNYITPITMGAYGFFGKEDLCFGGKISLTDAFGGINTGHTFNDEVSSQYCNRTFSMDGPGKLKGDFRYEYNCNYNVEEGVLVADAPGILGQMSSQHYDNSAGEGLIVAAGDKDTTHSFDVGKCFYTLFTSPEKEWNTVCEKSSQKNSLKLVVELSVDGNSWFYPINLSYLQPNTVYQIKNITIKKLGSEYSNFYEKKISCELTASVKPWDVVEVENINAGVDPKTGKPVE